MSGPKVRALASFMAIDLPAPEATEFEMGGGGLQSTMTDYGRFMRMILNDGELEGARVLAPETVAQMVTNQMGDLRLGLPLVGRSLFSPDFQRKFCRQLDDGNP